MFRERQCRLFPVSFLQAATSEDWEDPAHQWQSRAEPRRRWRRNISTLKHDSFRFEKVTHAAPLHCNFITNVFAASVQSSKRSNITSPVTQLVSSLLIACLCCNIWVDVTNSTMHAQAHYTSLITSTDGEKPRSNLRIVVALFFRCRSTSSRILRQQLLQDGKIICHRLGQTNFERYFSDWI